MLDERGPRADVVETRKDPTEARCEEILERILNEDPSLREHSGATILIDPATEAYVIAYTSDNVGRIAAFDELGRKICQQEGTLTVQGTRGITALRIK